MSNRMNEWRKGGGILSLAWALLNLVLPAWAEEKTAAPAAVPPDTAVLDVQLPPGAKVVRDGRPGDATRFTFGPIAAGRTLREEARIRFRDGKEATLVVLLRAGWHVVLPVASPGEQRPELVLQTGHSRAPEVAVWGPDGRHLLTGSSDKTAILWDAHTGRKLRTFVGHTDRIWSVAISPDGRRVLTGAGDRTAILWDAVTGEKLHVFRPGPWVGRVAFRPGGRHALTAGARVVLWDLATGAEVRAFEGHKAPVKCAAFSPDGKGLVTGSEDKTAILHEVDTGARLHTFAGHTREVRAVAFSPDGKRLLTVSGDRTAILWDAIRGDKLRTLPEQQKTLSEAAFAPDGKHILTGDYDGRIVLWDADSGRKVREVMSLGNKITALGYSPDGKRVLATAFSDAAAFWDAESGTKVPLIPTGNATPRAVAFGPGGRQLFTTDGSRGRAVLLWEPAGRGLRAFREELSTLSFALRGDGKRLLVGYGARRAVLWDVGSGKSLHALSASRSAVDAVAFHPDGKQLLTVVSNDDMATLWDAESGAKVSSFKGREWRVDSLAFSPDGKRIAGTRADATTYLWDASGKLLRELRDPEGTNIDISESLTAFSPDGKQLLTKTTQTSPVLWDVESGRLLRRFEAKSGWPRSAAFSPDGRWVLAAAGDTPILWDAGSGTTLQTFQGHTSPVNSVAFGPDGRRILTGSFDGTIRLWDVASGQELAALIDFDEGREWLVVTPAGLFDGSVGGRQRVSYRIGRGLNVVPVDRFFQDFYRPGLLAAVLSGERPEPELEIGRAAPPRLRIVAPWEGGDVEATQLTLEVEAIDQGGGVRGPTLFHNGSRVLAREPASVRDKTVRQRFDVSLVEGRNVLEVRAASRDGSQDSDPVQISLRYTRPLARPDLYVLTVGVSRYADEALNLKFAAADARALADLFRRRGRALYAGVHSVTLLDDKAGCNAIRKELEEIARRARPQDTLVVCLAGHGTMVGQRYYFLPHDFRRDAARDTDEVVRRHGLAADVLADALAAVPALKRLLILDTCASGGAVGLARKGRNPFAFRKAIERLSRSQGVFTLAAAAADEEAQEVKELGHGILTYALLAGLNAAEAGPLKDEAVQPGGPDRVASVLEWFNFAAGQVPRLTKKYFGREQDVQMSSEGNSFPLLPVEER